MPTVVGFDASCDSVRTILIDSLQKLKKRLPKKLSILPKSEYLSSGCTSTKSGVVFVAPTGLSRETVKNFSGHALS